MHAAVHNFLTRLERGGLQWNGVWEGNLDSLKRTVIPVDWLSRNAVLDINWNDLRAISNAKPKEHERRFSDIRVTEEAGWRDLFQDKWMDGITHLSSWTIWLGWNGNRG